MMGWHGHGNSEGNKKSFFLSCAACGLCVCFWEVKCVRAHDCWMRGTECLHGK